MKKTSFILCLIIVGTISGFSQGSLAKGGKQLNAGLGFSNFGTPVYVGLDFGVHESITIGPKISYRSYNYNFAGTKYNQSLTVLSFNGNYHFNKVLKIDAKWDFYAGLTVGYYLWASADFGGQASGIGFDGQIGGRYFFSDKFGINLEFGGGTGTGGNIGITYKF